MQAKKVRRVQSAFELFNRMMQTPGKSELTLTELRVSQQALHHAQHRLRRHVLCPCSSCNLHEAFTACKCHYVAVNGHVLLSLMHTLTLHLQHVKKNELCCLFRPLPEATQLYACQAATIIYA